MKPADENADPGHPLVQAVEEIERHVGAAGWDQRPRLYALAVTADLVSHEPALAAQLGVDPQEVPPDELTPVEQEDLPADRPLEDLLAGMEWPETVVGCVLALERMVLPPRAEEGMPAEEAAALEWARRHPDRADVRVVVGVLRGGDRACVLRVRGHEAPEDLVRDPEVSDDIGDALAATLA